MPSTRRTHFLSSNELLSMNCEHGSTMAHPRANAQAVGRRFHWSAGSACSNAATIHDVSRKLGTSASTREIDTQMSWRGNAHTHVVAREKHGAAAAALRGSGQVCARSRRLTVVNHELFDEVDVCEQHASAAVAAIGATAAAPEASIDPVPRPRITSKRTMNPLQVASMVMSMNCDNKDFESRIIDGVKLDTNPSFRIRQKRPALSHEYPESGRKRHRPG